MPPSLLADTVVLLHLAFVVFAIAGGLLVVRWRWVAWLHVPALAWALLVEAMGWICPLTPLENRLRAAAGEAGYRGDFVAHYLLPVLYPPQLTRELQWLLAAVLLGLNLGAYWLVWPRSERARQGR